jgi:hypothetical protein
MRRSVVLLSLALILAGCYHATVETGLQPGAQTVQRKWASGWILGLVPPSTVETMERCPSGVARVETQLSFANQLVSFLTSGIYTPMEIVVTCAAGTENEQARVGSASAFRDAIRAGEPFLVEVR